MEIVEANIQTEAANMVDLSKVNETIIETSKETKAVAVATTEETKEAKAVQELNEIASKRARKKALKEKKRQEKELMKASGLFAWLEKEQKENPDNYLDIVFSNVWMFNTNTDDTVVRKQKALLNKYNLLTAWFSVNCSYLANIVDGGFKDDDKFFESFKNGQFEYMTIENVKKLLVNYKEFLMRKMMSFFYIESGRDAENLKEKINVFLSMNDETYSFFIGAMSTKLINEYEEKNKEAQEKGKRPAGNDLLMEYARANYAQDIEDYQKVGDALLADMKMIRTKEAEVKELENKLEEISGELWTTKDNFLTKYNICECTYRLEEEAKSAKIVDLEKQLNRIKTVDEAEAEEKRANIRKKIKDKRAEHVFLSNNMIKRGTQKILDCKTFIPYEIDEQNATCPDADKEE